MRGQVTWRQSLLVLNCVLASTFFESLGAESRKDQKSQDSAQPTTHCVQCRNYNEKGDFFKNCPQYEFVNLDLVYSGQCNGTACFTRSYQENPKKVGRGCLSSQWGMPYPLPPDGCYNWLGNTWCVCKGDNCNGGPLGISTGVELDEHLYSEDVEPIVEEDGQNRCYECINKDSQGNWYRQCPKNSHVRNAYLTPCNGSCFTRSYGEDEEKVARGCSDTQWGLPDPLPPDGCYTWYLDVYCICSTSRCNRNKIGEPNGVEFDAHIKKKKGNDACALRPAILILLISMALGFSQQI